MQLSLCPPTCFHLALVLWVSSGQEVRKTRAQHDLETLSKTKRPNNLSPKPLIPLANALFLFFLGIERATCRRAPGRHSKNLVGPVSRHRYVIASAPSPSAKDLINEPSIKFDAESDNLWMGSVAIRDVTESQKKEVAYRQKYLCAQCGCLLPPSHEIDHIKPLSLGGTNGLSNLQALCRKCHTSKTRKQRHEVVASTVARRQAKQTPEVRRSKALTLDSVELSSLRLLRGMNRQQLSAVIGTDGPMRVAAGPGTGKTRVLTARIAYLIIEKKVKPRHVLSVTFTNKAARELRHRITGLIGPDGADAITMGTFHSICLAILRIDIEKLPRELGYRRGFTVYDEYASLKLITNIKKQVEGKSTAETKTHKKKQDDKLSAGAVQAIISAAKNDGYDAQTFRASPPDRFLLKHSPIDVSLVGSIFEHYQKTMRDENIIDFDDMLLLTESLLSNCQRTRRKYERNWRYITVDEFQDTNSVQYQILALLGKGHGNVFAVGDADQAIYGWRGADIRNQERFDSDFAIRSVPQIAPAPLPRTAFSSVTALNATINALPFSSLAQDGGVRLALELNYRSRQGILDMAERLLAPSYVGNPASQLHLVTPQTYKSKRGAVDTLRDEVQVIEVEDSEQEARFVVDQIIRSRMKASASNARPPSVAILYRTNTQSMAFERILVREGVPYVLAAQRSFYARKEIRDTLAYLRLLQSNDTISLERIINVPPRGIGAVTLARLHAAAQTCNVSLWGAIDMYAAMPEELSAEMRKLMPKLTKKALDSVSNFHSLIQRFRLLVKTESENDSFEEDSAHAAQLRLVSTQLPRQLERTASQHEFVNIINGQSIEAEDASLAAAEQLAKGGGGSLAALIRLLMLESGYEDFVKGEESASRWRNLGELANLADRRQISEITDFLDQIALVSDVDSLDNQGVGQKQARERSPVQLSTIHGAKGLEFDQVFVVGVEEGLLPHFYSSDTPEEIEEERRLLYVAMTRAKQQLTLTHSVVRERWGNSMPTCKSRFLDDLPDELQVSL